MECPIALMECPIAWNPRQSATLQSLRCVSISYCLNEIRESTNGIIQCNPKLIIVKT
jgi:hypothetical protein